MPTGSHECKEPLSCGKITKLKQAQKSFLFNAWIKYPRHRGHYCRWLWFWTAQHTSSSQPSRWSQSSVLSAIRSINTSFLPRLETTQGMARQRKLCHKDVVGSTECQAVQKLREKESVERTELETQSSTMICKRQLNLRSWCTENTNVTFPCRWHWISVSTGMPSPKAGAWQSPNVGGASFCIDATN